MGKYIQTSNRVAVVAILVAFVAMPLVFVNIVSAAPTYSSSSYGVDEVFMGAGGVNDASSASYRARASLGDTGVGNSSSSAYQAMGGFTTTPDPYLELYAAGGAVDIGNLTETTTATTTGTFSVRTYLASGYSVVIGSDAPKIATHSLQTNNTPTAPAAPGTEQFGMNLVANTSPATFGANPVQEPDTDYSFGQVDANYATANMYMFQKGDRIAYSNSSSGTTTYTVSYIYNISSLTPAGDYTFDQIIIATSTF